MSIDLLTDCLRVLDDGSIRYPYTRGDFKRDFRVSIPANPSAAWLAQFGVYRVRPTPRPDGDVVAELLPALINGGWTQQWAARQYTDQERAVVLSEARQRKLAELAAEQDRRVNDLIGAADERAHLNALRKGVMLVAKKADGTITQEEEGLLATLEGLGAMVEYMELRELAIAAAILDEQQYTTVEQIDAVDVAAPERW